jgi:hypothetical protein
VTDGAKALKARKQAARKPKPKQAPAAQESADNMPKEDALRMFAPGPEYWVNHSPDLAAMPTHRLYDELAQLEEFLARQITSSPELSRLGQVRDSLRAEATTRGKRAMQRVSARKAKRPKTGEAQGDTGVPRILRERSSIATQDPAAEESNPATLMREYDEIVAYLQRDDIAPADRKLLQTELANLGPAVAQALGQRSSERQVDAINRALAPDESIRDERERLLDTIRRVDSIRPVSGKPGVRELFHGGERIEMPDSAAEAIRKQALVNLDLMAYTTLDANDELGADYDEFVDRTFEKHKYVGFVSMMRSGQNPSEWYDDVLSFRQASNSQVVQYRQMRSDPWRSSSEALVPLAEKVLAGDRVAEAGRNWFNYKQGLVLEGTAGAIRFLDKTKTVGKYASYIAFKPLGAAAYAAIESTLEQASEVHYGQREKMDYLGIGLDAAANYVGAKVGNLVPGAGPEASWLARGASWAANDRVSAAATTASRMGLANLFEEGDYSAGDIARAAKRDLTDVRGMVEDALIHKGSKYAHAQHAQVKAGAGPQPKENKQDEGEEQKPQASATVLTQPKEAKPLELPVVEIDNPAKGKGTLAESQVPFHLYQGPEWNHIAGGEETASSRTSIARETEWGKTGGNDFLVGHVETDRLVIGEQKAVDSETFTDASAISSVLIENVGNTKAKLQASLDARRKDMHPEEVARLEKTIARLDATENALKNGTELPEGVVFEFTNVSGKGEQIGKEHVDRLDKAFDKPGYVEHLLGRTFVRDPKLAQAKGRDPGGKRGTDADPDIVPAMELLTPQAQDTVNRLREGMTEKQWEKKKAKDKADQAAEEKKAAQAAKDAEKAKLAAEEQAAIKAAEALGEQTRQERLKQLKEEQSLRNEPAPKNKKDREKAERKLEKEAKKAGKEAKDKAIQDFKDKRKQEKATKNAQIEAEKQAQAEAREKQLALEAEQAAKREALEQQLKEARERVEKMSEEQWKQLPPEERKTLEQQAKGDKKLAAAMAQKEGSLKTPESVKKLNEEARAKSRRQANLGKAAQGINHAAAGLRAIDAFNDARDKGKGYVQAGAEAGLTYLENTDPVIGTIGIATSRMQKDEKGVQYYGDDAVDAWLGTIGEMAGGYIVPGNAADQLVNAGANLSGAIDDHLKRGMDPNDPRLKEANLRTVTDLAADVTPSRMFSQLLGGGMRSYYDIGKAIGGDTHGVEKFADDALKGKLGSIVQPWAMAGDFASNLASDDIGTALEKTVKKTEGTTLTKLGYASGDWMYELGQSAEAKSGKYGMPVQGVSQMLGMATDLIAGQSFEKALQNAAEAGKGSTADKIGSVLGDAAFDTVELAKDLLKEEDLPAMQERVKQWWKNL